MASKTPEMLPQDREAILNSITIIRQIESDLEKAKMHSQICCLRAMTNIGLSSEVFSVGQLPGGSVGFIRKAAPPTKEPKAVAPAPLAAVPAQKPKKATTPAVAPAVAPAATPAPTAAPVAEVKRGRGRPRKNPAAETPATTPAPTPAVAEAPPVAAAATAGASTTAVQNEALVNDLLGNGDPA